MEQWLTPIGNIDLWSVYYIKINVVNTITTEHQRRKVNQRFNLRFEEG